MYYRLTFNSWNFSWALVGKPLWYLVPLQDDFQEECTFSPTDIEFCFGGDLFRHSQKSCKCQNYVLYFFNMAEIFFPLV